MDEAARTFLDQLLETPSPSGFEAPVQEHVRAYAASFADRVTTDVHGNVVAARQPDGSPRVLLAGHADQIGLLVTHIDEQGFLYVQPIGGWDPQQLVGQRMVVWTASGPLPAVISRKPIHLLTDQEKRQVVKLDELWLDIGARDQADASERVRIGDPVTLELGARMLAHDCINAPGLDDASGLWVVMEALRRSAERDVKAAIFAVSTVQEEVGLRGAGTSSFGLEPDVGIAVDVTHATDCPTIDPKQRGNVRLGEGPVIYRGPNMNPVVTERLIEAADRAERPYQLAAIGRATPTDANAIQISRAGVATGLLCVPNRYMHSAVEVVNLDDLDAAADILAEFLVAVEADTDWTPVA